MSAIANTQAVESVDADPYPHPTLPPPSNWPGVIIIVITLGFFLMALVLGPIVRATMRDELPPLK